MQTLNSDFCCVLQKGNDAHTAVKCAGADNAMWIVSRQVSLGYLRGCRASLSICHWPVPDDTAW